LNERYKVVVENPYLGSLRKGASCMSDQIQEKQMIPLFTLAKLFLKFGVTGFGGPAVVIAMLEEEVVQKNKWMTREHFLDLVGATNLIPGPNATEMASHIGYTTRGWKGLTIAGICFIIPSVLISLVFAILYVTFGSLPQMELLFYGIRPVVIAVIVGAVLRLGRKAAKSWQLILIAAVVIPLVYLFGEYIVIILLGGGIIGMLLLQLDKAIRKRNGKTEFVDEIEEPKGIQKTSEENKDSYGPEEVVITQHASRVTKRNLIISSVFAVLIWGLLGFTFGVLSITFPEILLLQLGFFFYGVGSIMFGGSYVLVSYIRQTLVEQSGWISEQQLLDSIAIGQFTPGPISSSAAVIGFILGGYSGAAISTFGLYFPSFLIVIILNPVLLQLRESKWAGSFLDAINISAVAAMLVTSFRLGEGLLIGLDILGVVVALALMIGAFCVYMFSNKINAATIIIGGAIIGIILNMFIL
jgi:chromate transporter